MRTDLGSPNLEESIRGWCHSEGYSPFALAPCKQFVVPLRRLRRQTWCNTCGEFHEAESFEPIAFRIRSLSNWWNPMTWGVDVIESKELKVGISDACGYIRLATPQ